MGRTLFIVSRDHPDLYAYLRERVREHGCDDVFHRQRHVAAHAEGDVLIEPVGPGRHVSGPAGRSWGQR